MQLSKKHINNKKYGFTFAELMISLVIITVITVILYPTIADLAPNNNKVLFKSTYKTIETIVSEITTSGEIPGKTNMPSTASANIIAACMCHEFMDRLNVTTERSISGTNTGCLATGIIACPNTKTYENTASANNTFITTNGVRWAFVYDTTNNIHEILVDVNASNNEINPPTDNSNIAISSFNLAPKSHGAKLDNIWIDEKTGDKLSNRGIYYTNVKLTQDTFLIKIEAQGDSAGKITLSSAVGYDHLRDKE